MSGLNKINFEIVTPEQTILKEEVSQVTVPTTQGEITILANHIPLVATLQAGVIEIVLLNEKREIMSLSGGFIEVLKDKIVVLADTAERAKEIDEFKLDEARKRAENLLKNVRQFDQERFVSISAQLAKELARSKALKRWKKIKSLDK